MVLGGGGGKVVAGGGCYRNIIHLSKIFVERGVS